MKFEFEDQKIDEVEKIDLRDFVISNKPTLVWASLNFPIYQNLDLSSREENVSINIIESKHKCIRTKMGLSL